MDRKIFDLYTDFLICSQHFRTATGLSDLLENRISHDQVTRFLSKGEYGSKELWLEVKPMIREIETENGLLSIDDTIEKKPYTTKTRLSVGISIIPKGKM